MCIFYHAYSATIYMAHFLSGVCVDLIFNQSNKLKTKVKKVIQSKLKAMIPSVMSDWFTLQYELYSSSWNIIINNNYYTDDAI